MIATGRLVLRPPAADDLPFILDEINTPAMMRHLGGQTRSADEVAEGLAGDIAAFASGDYLRWTVWLHAEDRRVGRVGLFRVRAAAAPDALRGQSEIGWMFGEAHWGQGYATEAARAVLDYGFAQMDREVIYSQTSDSNAASTRMMHRLGFERFSAFDYVDPDYPAADNPTTVYRLGRRGWTGQ